MRADHHFASPAAHSGVHQWLAQVLQQTSSWVGTPLPLFDLGAGSGELLLGTLPLCPADTITPIAVDWQGPPAHWPTDWQWCQGDAAEVLPSPMSGVVVALELLDEVPCDVAVRSGEQWHYLEVNSSGVENVGPPVGGEDLLWLDTWVDGVDRAEIGTSRDAFAATLCSRISRGLFIIVDYTIDSHTRMYAPAGTLTGYYRGRQVAPIPDGRRNLTAHVAVDSLAAILDPFGQVRRHRLGDLVAPYTGAVMTSGESGVPGGFADREIFSPLGSWGDFDVLIVSIG